MVDIEGPIVNPNMTHVPHTYAIKASESEPAVLYCRFIYHDPSYPSNNVYNFILYINTINITLDEYSLPTDQERRIPLDSSDGHGLFPINNTQINSSDYTNATNVIIYESQVHVSCVSSVTQIFIATCAAQYTPNGNECYSSSTFAIVNTPNDTCSVQPTSSLTSMTKTTVQSSTPTSTMTVTVDATTKLASTSTSANSAVACLPTLLPATSSNRPEVSNDKAQISPVEFGSAFAVLCLIMAIETILLIIFAYLFMKHKKSHGANSDEVIVIRHNHARDAETDNNTVPRLGAPNNGRLVQRINLPHMID